MATLNFTPPFDRDLYFYRGNFCGIRIPGAPVVPGSNPSNPECVMSALLDVYPDWVVDQYLEIYFRYYTHLQRSLGHALYYTDFERFKAVSRRVRATGLYNDVWMIANEFPGFRFNQDASFWQPKLDPYIDAMLGEGLIDLACPSWQMDQVMMEAPGNPTISIIAYVANKLPRNIPVNTHWMNEALAWWKTGGEIWTDPLHWPNGIMVDDRFTWWYAMQPYLTGGHQQGDTQAALHRTADYQSSLCDTLDYFAGRTDKGNTGKSQRRVDAGEDFRLNVYEDSAQDQFDGKTSESVGDGVGYALTCTHGWGNSHLSGYGNGARMPNGLYL